MSKLAKILLCCFVVCLGSVILGSKITEVDVFVINTDLSMPTFASSRTMAICDALESAIEFRPRSIECIESLGRQSDVFSANIKPVTVDMFSLKIAYFFSAIDIVESKYNSMGTNFSSADSGTCISSSSSLFGCPGNTGHPDKVFVRNNQFSVISTLYRSHGTILRFSNDLSRRI